MSIQYIGQSARFSEATIANGFIFLSGMVPENATTNNIIEQTRDVLNQIDYWLSQCGSNKNHILEATIFLRNLDDYAAMNSIWDEWINPNHSPARACIQAQLANPDWLIEIKVSALQIVAK